MKNSFRHLVYDALLEEIWSVIDQFDKNNESINAKISSNEYKKRDVDQIEDDDIAEHNENKKIKENNDIQPQEFNWSELIKKEVLKKENQMIELEKLTQKVNKQNK
jgi:hypothetical protein